MNCQEWSQLISKKLDGELTTPEAEKLQAHLDSCEKCRDEENAQARIMAAMERISVPPRNAICPEHFKKAFWIRTTHSLSSNEYLWFRVGAVAAVLLLAVAVLLLSHRLQRIESGTGHFAFTGSNDILANRALRNLHSNGNLTPVSSRESLSAFTNIQDFLGGALRWIAIDGTQSDLGISNNTDAHAALEVPEEVVTVTLQYVVQEGDGEYKTIANPKFIMVPGEEALAQLAPNDGSDRRWRYHLRADPETDGKIRVFLEFSDNSDCSFTTRTIVDDGVETPVMVGAAGDQKKRWAIYLWAATSALHAHDSGNGANETRL